MTVRARYKVEMALSSNSNEEKDLANVKLEVFNDEMGEGATIKCVLAASSSDVLIPLGAVAAAKFLAIRINAKDSTEDAQAISIKRNATDAEAIEIAPMGTKEGFFLLTTTGLTALYATNPSTVAMELTLIVAGD